MPDDKPPFASPASGPVFAGQPRVLALLRRAQSLSAWLSLLGGLVLVAVTGVINAYRNEYFSLAAFAGISLMLIGATWLTRQALERL